MITLPPLRRGAVGVCLSVLAVGLGGCAQDPLQQATGRGTVSLQPVPSGTPDARAAPSVASLAHVDLNRLVLSDARVPQPLRQQVRDCGQVCGVDADSRPRIAGLAGEAVIAYVNGFNGPVGSVVVVSLDGRPTVAFAHYGTDGVLEAHDGLLRLTRAMYALNDPEARPSGPPEVSTYRWQGRRFVLQSRTGGGAKYSAYLPTDQVVS